METKIPPYSSIEQQPIHCEEVGGISGEIATRPIKIFPL
ncbi:hypothetical protein T02_4274 [Trichinella nativa]|uniref:Uncharacterized protein n=1 Tax=Trichinella nativa TaxID=6335 RepID=A0A0V1KLU2_9BILA|nr:hypothetical protein T02_4274 [Trichinella nativa]